MSDCTERLSDSLARMIGCDPIHGFSNQEAQLRAGE
jgi:hypothetical protein